MGYGYVGSIHVGGFVKVQFPHGPGVYLHSGPYEWLET